MTKTPNMRTGKNLVELLFFGSPLLDITAHGSRKVLDDYGLKSDDCIRETEKHETLFQSLLNNPGSKFSAGGSSQNTARIAKWILGDKGKISFAGCVGNDDYANTMRKLLQSEGVQPLYITLTSGESSGICACLLSSEGDRSMCARLGAAELFATHHLLKCGIPEKIENADCIFVEGYFFSHSPDVLLSLAEKCSENQVFSVSLSAEYICRDYAGTLLKVLPRIDVLLSNEAEAKVLAVSLGMGDVAVEEIASALATKDRPSSMEPRIVLITRGPNPVLVARGLDSPCSFPVPRGIQVLDSVGCGDAMAGAFLAVYVLTGDVPKAVQTGILAAVEIAQTYGCNPPKRRIYPSEEQMWIHSLENANGRPNGHPNNH